MYLRIPITLLGLSVASAVSVTWADDSSGGMTETPVFTTEGYGRHIEVLASDEFEGRRPATPGGDLPTPSTRARPRSRGRTTP